MHTPYAPHEQRVLDEAKELNKKLGDLRVFISGDFFQTLEPEDRALLHWQEQTMTAYSQVLHQRIVRFD